MKSFFSGSFKKNEQQKKEKEQRREQSVETSELSIENNNEIAMLLEDDDDDIVPPIGNRIIQVLSTSSKSHGDDTTATLVAPTPQARQKPTTIPSNDNDDRDDNNSSYIGFDLCSLKGDSLYGQAKLLLTSTDILRDFTTTQPKQKEKINAKDNTTTDVATTSSSAFVGNMGNIGNHKKNMRNNTKKEDQGLEWYATIVPNQFIISDGDGKNILCNNSLNSRDFLMAEKQIKPRRASLPVTRDDFFNSLSELYDIVDVQEKSKRYIFNGILNGWPSLTTMELIRIEKQIAVGDCIVKGKLTTRVLLTGKGWTTAWKQEKDWKTHPKDAIASLHNNNNKTDNNSNNENKDNDTNIYRAVLRAPKWSAEGWSKESPGFVFWYELPEVVKEKEQQTTRIPRVSYGSKMENSVEDNSICTMVHMISHRYAVKKENTKDKITYHSVVLLEWNHRKYTTVIEAGFLNGVGGNHGKSNWHDDKDDVKNGSKLFHAMASEMIGPWISTNTDIRCHDMHGYTNLEEFKQYVEKYKGTRFVDPHYTFSHKARMSFRSKRNIAKYLVNYMRRDTQYSEIRRNCQTLAADLCAFLAGKRSVVPFHPLNRIDYQNRTHLFLYDSELY